MSVSASRTRSKPRPVRRRKRPLLKKASVRLIARLAVVLVAVVICAVVVGRVMRPIRLASHEQREKNRLAAEYTRLHKENETLRRQLRDLKTPEGVAREARKHGFVKPGEVSLIIPEPSQSPKSDN